MEPPTIAVPRTTMHQHHGGYWLCCAGHGECHVPLNRQPIVGLIDNRLHWCQGLGFQRRLLIEEADACLRLMVIHKIGQRSGILDDADKPALIREVTTDNIEVGAKAPYQLRKL